MFSTFLIGIKNLDRSDVEKQCATLNCWLCKVNFVQPTSIHAENEIGMASINHLISMHLFHIRVSIEHMAIWIMMIEPVSQSCWLVHSNIL